MSSELDDILNDVGVAEVIVKLKPSPTTLSLAAGPALGAARAIRAIPDVMGLFISRKEVRQQSGAAPLALSAAVTLEQRNVAPANVVARLYPRLGLAVGLVNKPAAAALRDHPQVDQVVVAPSLRLIRPVRAAPAKPTQTTWGITQLKVPQLWARGITGNGVVIGHLDTGVDGTHPALTGAIDAFVEFDMDGKQVAGAVAHDSAVHGTHTAGTIAGRAVAGKSFGMAPGAKLASALVIEGGDVINRILGGMEWIVGRNVRVLSMSLGIQGYATTFKVIVDALRQNNVLPIFAVGNEGVNTSRYPGNYDNVLSIGAFDSGGAVADFSSSQTFARPVHPSVPLLVGPGVGIISSVPGGTYEQMDGTSMATPHIAGLAALLLQANPGATMAQLEAAIAGSCTRLPGMTADRAGAGVPDAVRALTAIMGGAALPALMTDKPGAAPRPRKTAAGRAAAPKPRKPAPRKAKKVPKKATR